MPSPILLLHGALGSQAQLAKLREELSAWYEVRTLNFAGHGGRETDEKFSIDLFTDNVLAFMAQHQLERTHIFGYSMGGYVALNVALRQPEVVDRIVTFGTKFNWTVESANQEVKMLNPEVIEQKVPKFADHLAAVHHPLDWKVVLAKTAELMIDLGNDPTLKPADLAQIKQRVWIGIGDQDNMVTIEESQTAASHLANGELKIMAGFKHPLEKNDPVVLAEVICDYLAIG